MTFNFSKFAGGSISPDIPNEPPFKNLAGTGARETAVLHLIDVVVEMMRNYEWMKGR